MESIKRLRDEVKYDRRTCSITRYAAKVLLEIADAIEREVKDMRDFCERLDDAATKREDVTLWGVDYTPHPLDAEGEPIHIGDKVDSDHYEDGTVTGFQFYEMADGGTRTLIAVRPDGWDVPTWHTPDWYRHHHAPTVEDVLREMLDALDIDRCDDPDGTIAEYAAKLRLAGDE